MSHIEVEKKYRLTNDQVATISTRLAWTSPIRQEDHVFLQKSDSFDGFTPGDPVVRVRRVGDESSVALKAARSGSSAIELETVIADPATAINIIETLGLHQVTAIKKVRRIAKVDGCTVCLDEVDGLGHFLEIELIVRTDSEVLDAESKIDLLRERLSIGESQLEPLKYDVLLTQSARRRG